MTDATTPTPTPEAPCTRPEASQFDFWVGTWDATWADGGKGTNTITKILGGCVIQEQFDGGALHGLSVSTFDVRAGRWKQTWVDNQGGYLDFVGGFNDGKMTLTRQMERDGQTIHQRMVWFNIQPDQFDWHWEHSTDGGATWDVLWAIKYRRKPNA